MMSTILTLIILGMVFQGVVAVLDSILDTAGVNGMLKGLPIIGPNWTTAHQPKFSEWEASDLISELH